jgi:hypothetical protein
VVVLYRTVLPIRPAVFNSPRLKHRSSPPDSRATHTPCSFTIERRPRYIIYTELSNHETSYVIVTILQRIYSDERSEHRKNGSANKSRVSFSRRTDDMAKQSRHSTSTFLRHRIVVIDIISMIDQARTHPAACLAVHVEGWYTVHDAGSTSMHREISFKGV